jgi:potassium-dependent mechanosensitive channel
MLHLLLRTLLILCLMWLPVSAQNVEDGAVSEIVQQIEKSQVELTRIKVRLGAAEIAKDGFEELRIASNDIADDMRGVALRLELPLNDVRAQLAKLGPAPEAGQTEATKLAARERDFFFQRIFAADRSVLRPGLWVDLTLGTVTVASGIGRILTTWWQQASLGGRVFTLLALPFLLLVLGFLILTWRKRRLSMVADDAIAGMQNAALSRLMRVFWGVVGIAVFGILLFALIAIGAASDNVMTPQLNALLGALFIVFLTVASQAGLAWLICAPSQPAARLIDIDESAARALPLLVALASLASSLNPALEHLAPYISMPNNYTAGLSAFTAVVLIATLALALIVIRHQTRVAQDSTGTYYLAWFVSLMPLVWLLLAIAVLALLLGYVSFAYFITDNILSTALLLMLVALAHHLADAISEAAVQPTHAIGKFFAQTMNFTQQGISRLALFFRTGVDIFLAVLAFPALLATWTVSLVDFDSFYRGFSSGFTFGSITLSPWAILLGVLVMTLGVVLTRILTGWLNQRVLEQTSLDKGVQDSVRTAARYVGYFLAGALALSVAGLDFSNIAIIAGALGVGIGFGLQSIVNNFVSGLILLAERPVRVGDWVVTNAGEGIVKKINVRSTEIETFDNCSVIVPNSNLITEAVRNWTHRDSLGRFGVQVTVVSETTKLDDVLTIMTDLARAHPKVLRHPECVAQLTSITPFGLLFDLKGHVTDVFQAAQVASDLRMSLVKELQARKIKLAQAPDVRTLK